MARVVGDSSAFICAICAIRGQKFWRTLESIVEELKTLPLPKLAEAVALIHGLRETSRAEQLAILRETSGAWSGPDGEAIEKAIEEGCENRSA